MLKNNLKNKHLALEIKHSMHHISLVFALR